MSIVQEPERAAIDPRWIPLRVSRINMTISALGVLLALGALALVPLQQWIRLGLAAAFLGAFVWDLRLILMLTRQSVGSFYLFDLDAIPHSGDSASPRAKLGIRLRYVITDRLLVQREAEGVVLSGAFVSPWFTALRYALPQDPRWRRWWPHIIPLWPDSLPAEAFRTVRVALKWK
jgi:hypothetical protein